MTAAPLIVFGEDWGAHPSSTQHLVGRLAADRDVLWVNSIGLRRPRLDRHDLGRVAAKLSAAWRQPDEAHQDKAATTPPRLRVVDARAVSWPGSGLADTLNRRLVPASLRPHADTLRGGRPIVWSSLPTAAPIVDQLDPQSVIYYAGDDFSALAGVDHAPVARMEARLAERADIVIAASEPIARKLPQGKTRVLPHGCDIALFGMPCCAAADLPSDRPVAGVYGSISDWIDVALLAETARRLPSWQILVIGHVRTDVRALEALPNVTLAGPRAHQDLPAYSQHWTASLLPFRPTAQIAACNPLKLREYLAAGRPVIASVDFPALAPYRHLLTVAPDADAMVAALAAAQGDGPAAGRLRQQAVAGESWKTRSATVARWLSELG